MAFILPNPEETLSLSDSSPWPHPSVPLWASASISIFSVGPVPLPHQEGGWERCSEA